MTSSVDPDFQSWQTKLIAQADQRASTECGARIGWWFRGRPRDVTSFFGTFLAICGVMILVCGIPFAVMSSVPGGITWIGLTGALCLILGIALLTWHRSKHALDTAIIVYTRGLISILHGEIEMVSVRDICDIQLDLSYGTSSIDAVRQRYPTFTCRIVRRGGEPIIADVTPRNPDVRMGNPADLAEILIQCVLSDRVEPYSQALARGESVSFDPITLGPSGLSCEGESLTWTQIKDIVTTFNEITIVDIQGNKRNFQRDQVENALMFIALARTLHNSASKI